MNLKGIVALSGKPGLYRVIAQHKSGFVLETLDESKSKLVTSETNKLATLEDITIFGETDDITLINIFEEMKRKVNETPIPDPKSEGNALKNYFGIVAPDYDRERVYVSDIKKIINWYMLLSPMPLFNEPAVEEKSE